VAVKRILVTGGGGFIGSHLVDALVRRGAEVHVVDSFATGRPRNLAHLSTSRLVVHTLDAAKAPYGHYDEIYHLASPASPPFYSRHQRDTLLVNSLGTLRTLRIARRCGAKYLLASTSEIYGDPLVHPQAEWYRGNVNPTGPRSSYDEGKRFAEALLMAFVRETNIDARIVRIFNSYGPRMRPDDGRMPSSFIMSAVRGEPLRIEGSGNQTRSLCYVEDTVNGIRAAMKRGRAGEAYNIGRPDEISVRDFAEVVIRLVGSSSKLAFVAAREEDIRQRRPDIRKARRELNWSPRVPLRRGLLQTIPWFEREALQPVVSAPRRQRISSAGQRMARVARAS
jgi:nucleoside-diphosphate-sugar epimerase